MRHATALGLLFSIGCGALAEPAPEPPRLSGIRFDIDVNSARYGLRTDGTAVQIWTTVESYGGPAPASHVELTLEEMGPGASQRCVASWDRLPRAAGAHHVDVEGTFSPPCHAPTGGAYFQETLAVSWPDGQRVEATSVFLPLSLGGDDDLHAAGTEGAVAAALAASPLGAEGMRPTPVQHALAPELEALLDELASLAPLFAAIEETPEAARAPDVACPATLVPSAMSIELGELRDLAGTAEGSTDTSGSAIEHHRLYAAFTHQAFGSLGSYAHGNIPGPNVASAFPAPADGSFMVTLVTRYELPSVLMDPADRDALERHGTLEPGVAEGRVFVVDRVARRIACEGAFHAESSASVHGSAERNIVEEDFEGNIGSELSAARARLGASPPL